MSATTSSIFTRGSYLAAMALSTALLVACSTPATHPILYPNAKYNSVGETEAQTDVEQCMQMASNHGVKTTADSKVLESSAKSAAVGGASAGAWGAVRGDWEEHLLAGAAAGAAGGAVNGIINSNQANPVYKNFTQKCLRDQGYDVVGWK